MSARKRDNVRQRRTDKDGVRRVGLEKSLNDGVILEEAEALETRCKNQNRAGCAVSSKLRMTDRDRG